MSCARGGKNCKTGMPKGQPNRKSLARLQIRQAMHVAYPPIRVKDAKRPGSMKKVC